MALDFPTSPAVNQTYTFGSYTWRWDGTSWVGAVPIVNATINNSPIGGTTPSTGAFTSIALSPFIVSAASASTLRFSGTQAVSTLQGYDGTNAYGLTLYNGANPNVIIQSNGSSSFAGGIDSTAIGAATRSTGAFTTLTANAAATFTLGAAGTTIAGQGFGLRVSASSGDVSGILQFTNNADTVQWSTLVATNGLLTCSTAFAITGSSNLLVNRSGIVAPTAIATNVSQFVGGTGESISLEIDTFGATPFIYGLRSQGTPLSRTSVASGNNLLAIEGRGYQTVTSDSVASARILFQATENFTNLASGGKLLLQAVANGTTTVATVAEVSSTGLAVTGAISATNGISSTGSFFNSSGDSAGYQATDRTTSGATTLYRTGGTGYLFDSVGGNILAVSSTGIAVTGQFSTSATNGVNIFESLGVSSVGLQFRTNSSNRFKIETPSASSDLVFYSAGTTEVVRLSSTGLAVTGTLTATGIIESTAGGEIPLRLGGGGTSSIVLRVQNTGGDSYFGAERSTGGLYIVGSTGYDTIIRGPSGIAFSANAGASMHMRLSSTGNLALISGATINSSTPTIVALGVSGLLWMRDVNIGGTALVMWDASHNVSIVSQLGTVFTLAAPAAGEIQVSLYGTAPYGVQLLAGSTRNGDGISTSAIRNQ